MSSHSTATSAAAHGCETAGTTISDVHVDVLRSHILTRLPGPDLASASGTCSHLRSLISSSDALWSHACAATWPSTDTPRLRHVIAAFPGGPRSFFSASFPLLAGDCSPKNPSSGLRNPAPEALVSAVDLRHRGDLILSGAVETETVSGWFQNSPFRIDLLGPKESIPTPIDYPATEEARRALTEEVTLTWIVIDPVNGKAVNVSSLTPVSVNTHWLNGEVQIKFAAVVRGGERVCTIAVTCGAQMQVREVSLSVEDMEGKNLNGRDSLGILQGSLEGKMGRRVLKDGEAKKRYEEFLERKKERKERKVRAEGRLDTVCVGFAVIVFSMFWFLLLCR